jgi:hypothetical protein
LRRRELAELVGVDERTCATIVQVPDLAGNFGRFTHGFDTADLKDAKAFLDELSASQ